MSTQTKPSLVFCHGILADGSCFNKVMPAFQAEGYEVISAQYGLDTNARRRRRDPYYSGSGQQPGHPHRPLLRRRASSPPRASMTASPAWSTSRPSPRTTTRPRRACRTSSPRPPFSTSQGRRRARLDAPTTASRTSAATCPRRSSRSSGRPPPAPSTELFSQQCPGRRLEDQAELVHRRQPRQGRQPRAGALLAKRMNATTYDIDSSHVPMLSHPDFVIDVIRAAVRAVQEPWPR